MSPIFEIKSKYFPDEVTRLEAKNEKLRRKLAEKTKEAQLQAEAHQLDQEFCELESPASANAPPYD